MSLLRFNYELCNKCGYCAADCVSRTIQKDENDLPYESAQNYCIRCGHCEAICPEGAISVNSPELAGPVFKSEINNFDGPRMMNYMQMRRSIRSYENKPVDKVIIEQIMDSARFAPSAGNGQPVKWMVIHDKNEMFKLNEMLINRMKQMIKNQETISINYNFQMITDAWDKGVDIIFRTAPHLAFTYTKQKNYMSLIDSTIALSYFEMALPAFGLGGTWAGFFYVVSQSFPDLVKLLDLPEDNTITGGIMFGHPLYEYQRPPKRNIQSVLWK
jgi:nitroreductase/NAD-dependent dihydropyrimidine dehydrogenase PreA subunit